MNLKELDAIIKLLGDDDVYNLKELQQKLKEYIQNTPPSIWKGYLNVVSEKVRERLNKLLHNHNKTYVLDLARSWIDNPTMLSEGLYLVSRVFNPLIDYQEFLSYLFLLKRYFPIDLAENYTPVEIARYAIYIFFKIEQFQWEEAYPRYKYYLPDFVLQQKQGSNITIGLLIIALLQHLGIDWVLISSVNLERSFILIPIDLKDNDFFAIDLKFIRIEKNIPFHYSEIFKILNQPREMQNVLSLKSLIIALLQDGVIPRDMDDQWHIINRINSLIASFQKH